MANINRQRSTSNKYPSFNAPSNHTAAEHSATTTTSSTRGDFNSGGVGAKVGGSGYTSTTTTSGNNGVFPGAMVKHLENQLVQQYLCLPLTLLHHLTDRQKRVGKFLGIFIGSTLLYESVVIGNLCHRLSATLLLPLFAIATLYYWLAVAYRNTWSTTSIYLLFCACYVGEVIAQCSFHTYTTGFTVEEKEDHQQEQQGDTNSPHYGMPNVIPFRGLGGLYLLLTQAPLLLTVSAAGYLSNLNSLRENVVIGSVVFASRTLAATQLTALPRSIRPFVAYTCGLIGVIMAKYMETVFKRPMTNSGVSLSGVNNPTNRVHENFNSSHHLLPSPENTVGGRMPGGRRRRASSSANLQSHGPKGRRTSLPAISLQKNHVQQSNQGAMSSLDVALLAEAHGLITDMLADTSLPLHVVSGLRALSNLLSPPSYPNHIQSHTQRLRFNTNCDYNDDGLHAQDEIPIMGEKLSALPKKFRKSFQASLLRRMSTSTWTTTTSATGMPTLEPEPCRKRSTSFRNAPDLITSSSPTSQLLAVQDHYCLHERNPVSKYRSYSTTSLISNPLPHRRLIRERKTVCSLHPLTASDINRLHFLSDAAIAAAGGSNLEISATSSGAEDNDEDGRSGGELSDGGCEATANSRGSYENMTLGLVLGGGGASSGENSPCLSPGGVLSGSGIPSIRRADSGSSRVIYVEDGTKYDLERLAEDSMLDRIDEWDYPIFEFEQLDPNCILSKMCYRVFLEAGLFETFRIPMQEFLAYFHSLECGYRDKPYHNRMHAADVLHAVFYLTTQPIPGFTHLPLEDSPPPVQKSETGTCSPGLVQRQSFNAEDTYGIMGANLPALELMALYTAAAMHDYEHPGRTNAFLVTTYAPQAILYNDRSVLENHHAAAAWNLFLSKPDYNFLCHLDKAEFKRFRFLVIEAILATDLKRHFEILAEFNAKSNDEDAPGIDWNSEADRLLAMEMCIKLADINGPCKRHDIHVQWTKRIADEFYEQGDEEESLGLTISPFMNRRCPQLAKLQESFINHLVAPLCTSYGEAGLLPGQWVQDVDSDGEAVHEEVDEANVVDKGSSRKKKALKAVRKITSTQTQHLKENHDHWTIKVREEAKLTENSPENVRQHEEGEDEEDEAEGEEESSPSNLGDDEHAIEMETIDEEKGSEVTAASSLDAEEEEAESKSKQTENKTE